MIEFEKTIAIKTLKILETKSWNHLSFNDIIYKKNIKKNSINKKIDLIKNINRYVDWLLIKESKELEQSTSKDMLFEVLMSRFDILQLYRKSFINIYKAFKKSPKKIIQIMPSFLESMITTAELAKFDVNGLKGSIRLKGLIVVYFLTFLEWIDDNTSSLEKTMTKLDKNLDQAEKFGKLL